ncbi:hypothetical protein M427DRAFT_53907 [Gonapodya prolifera JEL478]|uniref:Uncharacterized protein n=1 Tax=Gonapodya prolifera (strain JEL478) TaxID=1344416 RepID=A0A139APX2_GONPJ|nr:hypothetical protein M427DRAFT_53907 [Gonapodya prolifera JEL478]|eukprot:KXS18535.1 hypothetical protein M427DRAFT_53907 [Gonapodya prolifera JEL478]
MAVLHGVQAVACLGAGLAVPKLSNFKTPFITVFTDWSTGIPVPSMQNRGLFPFVAVVSGFGFLSSLFHVIVLLFFKTYLADLRRGINKFRWIEYAFSSSLMIGLIGILFGMYDIISLILVMSVNACMNFFGYMMELHNSLTGGQVDWTAFWFGTFAGVVPWAAIFSYLGTAASQGNVPGFVWAILVTYFVMFNTFPINMIGQYMRRGFWADKDFPGSGYYKGEKVYQVLSLVAKSLLLWLVVGGANQPNAIAGR